MLHEEGSEMVSAGRLDRSRSSSMVGSPRFMEKLLRDRAEGAQNQVSPRQAVEQRKGEKREAEEAALVFSPRIPSSSEKLDRGRSEKKQDTSPRHTRLYQDALKRRTEGPKLKTVSPTTELDGFGFSPRIPRRSRSLSKDRFGRGAKSSPTGNGADCAPSVSEWLHSTKGSLRERAPSSNKDEEVFHPKIPRRSASLVRSSGDLEARWRSADARLAQELQMLRAEVDEEELAPCSFVPAITKMAKKLGTSSSKDGGVTWTDTAYGGNGKSPTNHKAADRLMRYKKDLLAKKEFLQRQHQEEERKALSPTPTIPRKSRALTATHASSGGGKGVDVHTRLARSPTRRVADAVIADVEAMCPFQPKLPSRPSSSPSTSTWTETGDEPEREAGEPVHERLHREAAARKKAQEEADRKVEEAARAFPYAPTLPPTPPTVGNKAADAAYPESWTIFDRLASDVTGKNFMHALLEQVHAEIELEPCTFHPAVTDPLAQKRAREGPVLDRLLRDEERTRREVARMQLEKLAREAATLQARPAIPSTSVELAQRRREELRAAGAASPAAHAQPQPQPATSPAPMMSPPMVSSTVRSWPLPMPPQSPAPPEISSALYNRLSTKQAQEKAIRDAAAAAAAATDITAAAAQRPESPTRKLAMSSEQYDAIVERLFRSHTLSSSGATPGKAPAQRKAAAAAGGATPSPAAKNATARASPMLSSTFERLSKPRTPVPPPAAQALPAAGVVKKSSSTPAASRATGTATATPAGAKPAGPPPSLEDSDAIVERLMAKATVIMMKERKADTQDELPAQAQAHVPPSRAAPTQAALASSASPSPAQQPSTAFVLPSPRPVASEKASGRQPEGAKEASEGTTRAGTPGPGGDDVADPIPQSLGLRSVVPDKAPAAKTPPAATPPHAAKEGVGASPASGPGSGSSKTKQPRLSVAEHVALWSPQAASGSPTAVKTPATVTPAHIAAETAPPVPPARDQYQHQLMLPSSAPIQTAEAAAPPPAPAPASAAVPAKATGDDIPAPATPSSVEKRASTVATTPSSPSPTQAPKSLPRGVTKHTTPSGKTYYSNAAGMTSWDVPKEDVRAVLLPPLPTGWKEYMHADNGKIYYHHAESGQTTWQRPTTN